MKSYRSKSILFVTTFLFILTYSQSSFSLEIEGVTIPATIKLESESLILNGAGIRTKFFFNIYIGSLYLKNKESNIDKILNDTNSKRIALNFLYKEVSKEKLVSGWTDGFQNNNDDAVFSSLKTKLNKFNNFFTSMHKGDSVILDFFTNTKTRVTINNQIKGEIVGNDFQMALLKVWLGDDPADYSLKDAMLGATED